MPKTASGPVDASPSTQEWPVGRAISAAGTSIRPSRSALRAERGRQILDVAAAEFARCGYAGTSIATIAFRAGVSKPVIYQYFGSKDGVFLALVRRLGDQVLPAIIDTVETAAPEAQPLAVLHRLFTLLEPQRHLWSVVADPSVPPRGEIARTVRRYRRQVGDLAVTSSARLLREHGDCDALDASALAAVWMSTVSALIEWWLDHPRETAADMTARADRLLTALLR